MDDKTLKTLEAMKIYGGSFVKILADLFSHGDYKNQAKLKVAFKAYFRQYEKMAEGKNLII